MRPPGPKPGSRGEFAAEIADIKAQPGADVVVWGGSRPVGAGRGEALFDQLPASRHLELVETTPFPSGIVVQVYRPRRD
jgi:hypothetical protein